MALFLYGPPGSGKSALGKVLAGRLGMEFVDLDEAIVQAAGLPIPGIFARETEQGFRLRELEALKCVSGRNAVVALGGGALLAAEARRAAEAAGKVLFLDVPLATIEKRIMAQAGTRPLADRLEKIAALMAARREHYASFPLRLEQTAAEAQEPLESRAGRAEVALGRFRIASGDVPSDVYIERGLLSRLPRLVKDATPATRAVVVADANTAPLWGARVASSLSAAGLEVSLATIPAGEETKNIATVAQIWNAFLKAGLSRKDIAVAVGGGVTGDMTGFAAATWMRGIDWVNVPVSLLSMVDASTGGKTGCDLPEGKNLVGAFHSPRIVAIDPDTLATLPASELACGWAEAVKHAILDESPALWRDMQTGRLDVSAAPDARALSRILAVKIRTVRIDPRETAGERAKLNLGHTFGHALEIVSDFALKHGQAVAIGTVMAAKLAAKMFPGEVAATWPRDVAAVFAKAALPIEPPAGMDAIELAPVMKNDKKKAAGGVVQFVLPLARGDVRLVKIDLAALGNF